ncbi:hypothetical protein H8B15_09020 [Hymenobacter sp. BT507]|uniref:Uncharacterized protein n=1 Tax=Hymenobacter citatus TaxID=2763506 RepID=A0ABR7MJ02_9BACT|nr:hypothetical protein [Hymenobacter citatus]MBC6611063.1 hypothetical protein [Hymenobacter citatus]
MHIRIQQQKVEYQIEGASQPADDRVLLATDTDLTAGRVDSSVLSDSCRKYFLVGSSTTDSSLTLAPESRTERTSGGAIYNGTTYSVPALNGANEPLELVRPNPGPDEVLLFSPYLLHGGALNLNADATRISLEMRFWAV